MCTLHCTKKLLDRIKLTVASSLPTPTTVLGTGYATAPVWKPQVALLVNERTLLPVLMPLAPATTLDVRSPHELAATLVRHGASQAFIAREVAAMDEVSVAATANRSVVGTMSEFAFLAEGYRKYLETSDLLVLSMRLADTPCSAIRHNSPARLIIEFIGASTH
jgi:hypothetical protein